MTDLDNFRAMLDRVGEPYEAKPAADWGRHGVDLDAAAAAYEQRTGRNWWQHGEATAHPDGEPLKVQLHDKPGWTSVWLKPGFISWEFIFDSDGNLIEIEDHE